MTDQVVFDETWAAALEAFYKTRDVLHRRGLVMDALAPEAGDHVLDVGCGPGFYVADILDRVGETGSVTGLDPSSAMVEMTRRRVEGRPNVTVLEGEATRLPGDDASFDRALSVQVFEYLADVDAALAELMRVLRPGGRLVIWDIDWSTVSWHSGDPERMARMLREWDRHLSQPTLPRTLLASLARAGFADADREAHVFAGTSIDLQTFAGAMPFMIRQYLSGLADVDQGEADAWLADLQELDERGEYAFAFVQFCFTATRPG